MHVCTGGSAQVAPLMLLRAAASAKAGCTVQGESLGEMSVCAIAGAKVRQEPRADANTPEFANRALHRKQRDYGEVPDALRLSAGEDPRDASARAYEKLSVFASRGCGSEAA